MPGAFATVSEYLDHHLNQDLHLYNDLHCELRTGVPVIWTEGGNLKIPHIRSG
jgi:hypothetical protein